MSDIVSEIRKAIGSLHIPPNRILFLHVRLKNLKQKTNKTYTDCTRFLLDSFNQLKPAMILVPSFTESFTKTGIHHSLFSKSESGRFSEEIRNHFAKYRSLEPVHSVLCTNNEFYKQKRNINCLTAFGEGSLYEYLHNENAYIINFDLEKMVSVQFHYVETVHKVPYRYIKQFSGVIYKDEKKFFNVDYSFNVRDLAINPILNREKIEEYLNDHGDLQRTFVEGMKISCISTTELMNALSAGISDNPYFMVE